MWSSSRDSKSSFHQSRISVKSVKYVFNLATWTFSKDMYKSVISASLVQREEICLQETFIGASLPGFTQNHNSRNCVFLETSSIFLMAGSCKETLVGEGNYGVSWGLLWSDFVVCL